MTYYNPYQMPAPMSMPQQQPARIDPQQFTAVAATLNQQSLNQLVQMARQRGISETDIAAGLQFIQSLR